MRMEWGIRPSMITVLCTPRRTASTQQSILGIMPPEMMPCRFKKGTSLMFTKGISVEGSSLSRISPAMSVMRIRFSAFSSAAIRAAAVSAFTL